MATEIEEITALLADLAHRSDEMAKRSNLADPGNAFARTYADNARQLRRAAKLLREHVPTPLPVRIWYMRDNHTFRELPLDIYAALGALRNERDKGHTYGMLCSKHPDLTDVVHAPGADGWADFETEARTWLERARSVSERVSSNAKLSGASTEREA